MASISQKVPIPLPVGGVMRDENPRKIGAQGLVESMNWIYRDGVFSVRPGLETLNLSGNLFIGLPDSYEDIESLAWLNDDDVYPDSGESESLYYKIATDEESPSALMTQWRGWDAAENGVINVFLTSEPFPTPPPPFVPSFLDHGGDGMATMTIPSGNTATICSPVVPISSADIEAQIKTWIIQPENEPLYTLKLYFLRYDGDEWDSLGGYYRDEVASATLDYTGTPGGAPAPFPDDPEPIRCSAYNDGTYTHAIFALTVEAAGTATVTTYFGDAQISYGENSAYYDPGGAAVSWTQLAETAMGIVQFDQNVTNSITVAAGDKNWFEMNSDFTWAKIEGAEWSKGSEASKRALPSFRVFDGNIDVEEVGDHVDARRFLVGVNGESNAIYWDGSEEPGEVMEGDTGIKAKAVAVNSNRMLYCGTVEFPDGVWYTDDLTVAGFDVDASLTRLADSPGSIVGAMEMGNLQTAIYKTDAIYMCIGQGGSPPFRFELRTAYVDGPASPVSIVPISDGIHVFLSGSGDVVMFDGVRPRSMGKHLQAYIQSTMDSERMNQSFGFYDKENKDVFFFYPPYGATESYNSVIVNMSDEFPTLWPYRFRTRISCGNRVVLNLSKSIDQLGSVSIDELEGTIDSFGSSRPALVLVGEGGSPKILAGHSDDGAPIEARFKTGLFDMGSITQWKTVKEIDHLFDAGPEQTINIDLLVSNFGNEGKSDAVDSVALARGSRKLSRHRTTGRLFAMAVDVAATQKVEWLGSEAAVSLRGFR